MHRVFAGGALSILLALALSAPQPSQAARSALPAGFSRVALGAGLKGPTAMDFTATQIYVTEKSGAIRVIRPSGTLRNKQWHTLNVSQESERGLLGIALDPNFSTNARMFVYYTTGPGAKLYSGTPENRVSRLKKGVNKVKEKILLDHIPSTAGNHNGGDIHFGFDGKLYISIGESGCCPADAQELDTLRGKIIRLNADGSIPSDNPFFNTPGARQEIYAYGFRNPWRFAGRSSNQTYLVADVGSGTWEEISSLEEGGNFGWPVYEGPCPLDDLDCDPNTVDYGGTIPPIHWYNHSSGDETGNVIAGGVFAENSNYPAPYADAYFYSDSGAGWVHVLSLDGSNQVTDRHDFDDGLGYPVSFGRGPNGQIHVADYTGDVIYRYDYIP